LKLPNSRAFLPDIYIGEECSATGAGRPREVPIKEMAEIKDKCLLTYKHLRCSPEDRMRKRGTYGLTNAINPSKTRYYYTYNSSNIEIHLMTCCARASRQTPKLLDGPLQKTGWPIQVYAPGAHVTNTKCDWKSYT